MPAEYFSQGSESLRQLLVQSVAECEGKRMKLKKASLTILNDIRLKVAPAATLEHVLIEVASLTPEKAAQISK